MVRFMPGAPGRLRPGLPGLFPGTGGRGKPVTAGEILQRVDENRMFSPDFAFAMEITSYKNGEIIDEYTLAGYVRIREANTQTLLYFLAPPKVNGQKMLMNGKEIWMHFPKTKNVIKLSPRRSSWVKSPMGILCN